MKNKAMLALAAAALGSALSLSAGAAAPVQFNMRDFGAKGDGVAKDTGGTFRQEASKEEKNQ